MNILDILILLCFIPAVYKGITKGFVKQIIALFSLILGVWLSFKFTNALCLLLSDYLHVGDSVLTIIAFALILIGVIFVMNIIGKLISVTIKFVMLGWLDKILGILFSVLKVGIIVGLIIILFDNFNNTLKLVNTSYLNSSILYNPLRELIYKVFPYLKELISSF